MAESVQPADIEKDVRELVAEVVEMEPEEVDGGASFVKDLGMDSMMALEILAGIEKKYRIVIPEDTLPKFTDLNTTISLVKDLMKKNN